MVRHRMFSALGAVGLTIAIAACDSDSPSGPSPTSNPVVTGVTPARLEPSPAPQTITVTGERFPTDVGLEITPPPGVGAPYTVPPTSIHAAGTTSFEVTLIVDAPGIYGFTVRTGTGVTSNKFMVDIRALTDSTPQIASVSPDVVLRNAPVLITIGGTNFDPALTVTLMDPTGLPSTLPPGAVTVPTSTSAQFNAVFNQRGVYFVYITNPTSEISNLAAITVQ